MCSNVYGTNSFVSVGIYMGHKSEQLDMVAGECVKNEL